MPALPMSFTMSKKEIDSLLNWMRREWYTGELEATERAPGGGGLLPTTWALCFHWHID